MFFDIHKTWEDLDTRLCRQLFDYIMAWLARRGGNCPSTSRLEALYSKGVRPWNEGYSFKQDNKDAWYYGDSNHNRSVLQSIASFEWEQSCVSLRISAIQRFHCTAKLNYYYYGVPEWFSLAVHHPVQQLIGTSSSPIGRHKTKIMLAECLILTWYNSFFCDWFSFPCVNNFN